MLLQLYRDVLHIKIVEEFDIDLYLTFMNFQPNSSSTPCEHDYISENVCIMLYMHPYKGVYHNKCWKRLMLTFVLPFGTFNRALNQMIF